MRIWGKLLGFVAGILLTHDFAFGLLGAVLGHVLIDSGWVVSLFTSSNKDGYIEPLFALMGVLAKSDGRVSEAEVAICEKLMTRLELDPLWRRRAIEAFNRGKAPGFDMGPALNKLREWCLPRRSSVMPFLDMLCDVALADGPLTIEKSQVLKHVATWLRVNEAQLVALLAMKRFAWGASTAGGWSHAGGPRQAGSGPQAGARPPPRSSDADPYAVLGVPRDADARTIKRAYRKLISKFHPDRLGNMPEDMRRRAEARASEINTAWERIQSERGFR